MKAQPGPMVSGSHFFPKAPLLWVKWMPDWVVMSRKWGCWAVLLVGKTRTHHRDTETQRNLKREVILILRQWRLKPVLFFPIGQPRRLSLRELRRLRAVLRRRARGWIGVRYCL